VYSPNVIPPTMHIHVPNPDQHYPTPINLPQDA